MRTAQKARIGYGSSTVDRFGYGVFSSLTPYRENTVALDISDLDNDIEMKSTSTTVVPRQGAVIFSTFETDQRRSAVFNLTRSDGQPLPFAASVFDTKGISLGAIGQGGQAFVRGVEDEGDIIVRWAVKISRKAVARIINFRKLLRIATAADRECCGLQNGIIPGRDDESAII